MSPNSPDTAPVGRKRRLFLRIEAFARRRYGIVFLVALAVLVAGTWLGSRLELESDVLTLIPSGNRKVDTFRQSLRDFGSIDYLLVLLDAGEGDEPGALEEFADIYAEKLQAMGPLVESVEYRFQPDPRFLDLFSENALLFVPPSEIPQIAGRLTDEAIGRQVRDNRLMLMSPAGSLADGLVLKDPLGLMPLLVGRLLSHRGALKIDLSSGYYLSTDGRSIIMLVKPKRPSMNLAFSRQLLDAARKAEADTRDELSSGETSQVNTRVRFSGNPATLVEEAQLLGGTMVTTGVVSLFAVLALYLVCYRRIATLLYSSVPLMIGQAVTFGIAFFTLGSLNSVSAALPALLMGLGTDFTIIMYSRYVEERQSGRSLAEATGSMVGEAGLGVFTGAITSAGTFYAMCVSRFRGLSDLGFLIGTGILVCAVAILFLLPAMITWNEGRVKWSHEAKRLHLQSIGLEHLLSFSARHARLVLGAVAVLTAAAVWLALGLEFDPSINALRSNRSASYQVQQEIAERFGASLSYMIAIAEGRDIQEATALSGKIQERMKPFLADHTIGRVESILEYLPPVAEQEKTLEKLHEGAGDAFNVARITATFSRALDENGFRAEPFADYLTRMDHLLSPARPITLDDLEGKGLGRIVDRFVKREPGRVRIVTYLYPTDPRWRRVPPPGLVEAIMGADEGITVTGTNVVAQELRALFYSDASRAVLLGLVIVALLLFMDFRSLRLTSIAMAQLVAGVVMMLGCMRLLGMSINYANAFVATMIMGVGIDYSIHLIHRLNLNGGRIDEGLLETGKGVVLAALTNVAGFGTLTVGNYPALRSLGIVSLLGSVTCLFTALTLVPALMTGRPPRDAEARRQEKAA